MCNHHLPTLSHIYKLPSASVPSIGSCPHNSYTFSQLQDIRHTLTEVTSHTHTHPTGSPCTPTHELSHTFPHPQLHSLTVAHSLDTALHILAQTQTDTLPPLDHTCPPSYVETSSTYVPCCVLPLYLVSDHSPTPSYPFKQAHLHESSHTIHTLSITQPYTHDLGKPWAPSYNVSHGLGLKPLSHSQSPMATHSCAPWPHTPVPHGHILLCPMATYSCARRP